MNWSKSSIEVFELLDQCRNQAGIDKQPVLFPLGDGLIMVDGRGYGSGKATHFEYVLHWCGVKFALSPRSNSSRQMPNFDLTISGEPCLLFGFAHCRQRILGWIEDWGGEFVDEWTRRLDICLDLPGMDARSELFQALEDCRYVAGKGRCVLSRVEENYTGFSFGSQVASIVIYDKLAEVIRKSEAYQQGMVLRRWNGRWPEAATRVEYRVTGKWLKRFGIHEAERAVTNLPAIVEQLTATSGRRFFVVTKDIPDRQNRHQDRAPVHPLWQNIVTAFRHAAGESTESLQRVNRRGLQLKGYFVLIFGLVTSAAAQSARRLDCIEAAVTYFRDLMVKNEMTDAKVLHKFEKKARKTGTWNEANAPSLRNDLAA